MDDVKMLNFQNMLNVFRTFSLGKNCNVEKNHSCKILESRGRECVHFFSGLTFMMVSVHSVLLGGVRFQFTYLGEKPRCNYAQQNIVNME